jgi:predicted transposase YdaD
MGDADNTFRKLVRDSPQPLLRLVFPGHQIEPAGPVDSSVDLTKAPKLTKKLTVDNLFRVREDQRDSLVHVEVERKWLPSIPPRLFNYAASAVVNNRLPVTTIVVLLRPGGKPPEDVGVYRIPGIEGDSFTYRYHVVPLWRLDAREALAKLGLSSAPFCAAMQGADDKFLHTMSRDLMTGRGCAELNELQRSAALDLLLSVVAAKLGQETAQRIFDMDSLRDDPEVQGFFKRWKAEGRAEGKAEGRAEGKAEALLDVLAARSFKVTDELRARIAAESDVALIAAWLKKALTAGTIDDVFRDD